MGCRQAWAVYFMFLVSWPFEWNKDYKTFTAEIRALG